MNIRKIIATIVISVILIQNTVVAFAEEDKQLNNGTEQTSDGTEQTSDLSMHSDDQTQSEDIADNIVAIPDIDSQLDTLYDEIGTRLGVDKSYIKQIHLLAGGRAIYAEKKPDIRTDLMSKTDKTPLYIDGADINYIKAEFIKCKDDTISRPSEYYLPDALYSISYDIVSLMSQRYYCNRGGYQIYYDSLQDDVKKNIAFYEAILMYTGAKVESVDKFYLAYEKMLYDKSTNENVIEKVSDNTFKIKDKFIGILNSIGIESDKQLGYLAIALSFDKNLAVNDSVETLQEIYNVPYKPNYTSRENMMVAAASLCGKVRYVWGGGHSGASYIDGINPMWEKFESLYPDAASRQVRLDNGTVINIPNEGYNTCIKPSGSWCPIHGYTNEEFHGGDVHSLQEYIDISAEHLDSSELADTKYRDMLDKIDFTDGINIHTLDGLDCSGFASWLYNQITDKYEINSTAQNFTQQAGISQIKYSDTIYPGDIFAWTDHIVIIVGKVNNNNKAFVTIEQTPNVLKYGALYYRGARLSDIELAKRIAAEANELIGGIDSSSEKPHAYCMDSVGIYTVQETVNTDTTGLESEGNETVVEHIEQYREIGRFKDKFLDEEVGLTEYGTPIKYMRATDIIQHTISKLPISYISGYNTYNGKIFDKTKAATQLGINVN